MYLVRVTLGIKKKIYYTFQHWVSKIKIIFFLWLFTDKYDFHFKSKYYLCYSLTNLIVLVLIFLYIIYFSVLFTYELNDYCRNIFFVKF